MEEKIKLDPTLICMAFRAILLFNIAKCLNCSHETNYDFTKGIEGFIKLTAEIEFCFALKNIDE